MINDSPYLFVPIAVEALLVNDHVLHNIPFIKKQPKYKNLDTFESPEERFSPIGQNDKEWKNGICLHWALPDALTHGVQNKDQINFPLVPNRWLVVRFSPWKEQARPSKAWVIKSDYLNSDKGTNPFLDPFSQEMKITKLGTHMDLGSWDGEPPSLARLFLTAIGPADISFAAFAPGVQDVFSFYDEEIVNSEETDLTYAVIGWYSDPDEDPLSDKKDLTWQERMDELKWSVKPSGDTAPRRCLFHGMIHTVTWQKSQLPQRPLSKNEQVHNVNVAVGNTVIDALTALLKNNSEEKDNNGDESGLDVLDAFQLDLLDLLDRSDGKIKLEQKIHQAGFNNTPGGSILWQIVSKEGSDGPGKPALITSDQENWLAELNRNQRDIDLERQQLASNQRELYDLWWKKSKGDTMQDQGIMPSHYEGSFSDLLNEIQKKILTYKDRIDLQKKNILALSTKLPDPDNPDSILAFCKSTLPDTLTIKPNLMPRFWHPLDPVILIQGLERSQKHGEDGRFTDDDTLLCRLPEQMITGISIDGKSVSSAQFVQMIPFPDNKHLPHAIRTLCTELFFLDPANADIIAAGKLDTDKVQSAIKNQSGMIGTTPSPLSVVKWTQAWSPLFIEWQINWLPTYKKDDDDWIFDFQNWSFNGRDYDWNSEEKPDSDLLMSFNGHTILTSHSLKTFGDRLKKYLTLRFGDADKRVNNLLDTVEALDCVSQTLGGFTEQLIMRDTAPNRPPDNTIAGYVGDQYHSVPYVARGDVDDRFGGAPPFFFPFRGGFFEFTKLVVIDSFGQAVNLLRANNNYDEDQKGKPAPEGFHPILSSYLMPVKLQTKSYVKQALRLVQSCRLNFRFVSSENNDDDIDLLGGTTPVCGWLLPSHLENGVYVYNNKGMPQGEMLLPKGENKSVIWQSAPSSSASVTDISRIENAHLKGLVQGLAGPGENCPVFEKFLRVIDATLWSVRAAGDQNDQDLSMLIGRPIAVIRARLQFTLAGKPVCNQSWKTTLNRDDGGVTNPDLSFPIRLGSLDVRDDGLIGYFIEDDYNTFNTVYCPDEPNNTKRSYILPIGKNNNYISLNFSDKSCVHITMLVDPRWAIHATSGLLPVKKLEIPEILYKDILSNLEVTIRTSPLFTQPDLIHIPMPEKLQGDWTWLQPKDNNPTKWDEIAIAASDPTDLFPEKPPTIRDGWLKYYPLGRPGNEKKRSS